MIQNITLSVLPEIAHTNELLEDAIIENSGFDKGSFEFRIRKRSIDARRAPVKVQLSIDIYIDEAYEEPVFDFDFKTVTPDAPVIHIIGSGPAGLFAALEALERGVKPIIYERGKPVQERRKDLAKITKEQVVNPESNYCYGEGGAGTYSDGKLYTRSKKKGSVRKILQQLVFFGADRNILVEAHPHIGTNKLPQIIETIRNLIIEKGGEVNFDSKLTDIIIKEDAITQIEINGKELIDVDKIILATGHSARDIFRLLDSKKIELEFKPFALGVRIEHTQDLIDKIQYKSDSRGEFLPPAAYTLVHNTKTRGVYSFCMCPGGIIAPCATENGEVVTNGWSPSKRNNPYSNSGIVTEVRWDDIKDFHQYGALAGMEFQRSVEQACWKAAGETQKVPAQRLLDFLDKTVSVDFPRSSYFPGLTSVDLNTVLPRFIVKALREGFVEFDKKMRGYLTNDAVLHAVESRTSSPVRIPRERDTYQHPQIKGLYPCAEGAGFAGGIVSAAIDGQNIVAKIFEETKTK
jgi:uncharacterized FAD-dependent dehydrogenase